MVFTQLTPDIIVFNILIPFIINPAPTFKDAVQPIIRLSATNKYYKELLEESKYKTDIHNTLLAQLKNQKVIDILNNITTSQQAQQVVWNIAKGKLFLTGNNKNLPYMNRWVVNLLIKKGAQINKGTTIYNSPLSLAIRHNDQPYFIEALLAHGADHNQRNENGSTPLMLARANDKHDVYAILLKYGADRDAKDNYGYTVNSDLYTFVYIKEPIEEN